MHGNNEKSLIASIVPQNYYPKQAQPNWRARGSQRFNQGGRRGSGRGGPRYQITTNCWRCGGIYHRPSDCSALQKDCRRCGRMGHIERMCSSQQNISRPFKRTYNDDDEPVVEKKIAAIKGAQHEEEEVKVCDGNEELE